MLSPEEIKAIASEVVRQLRQMEGNQMDAAYLASQPVEERVRLSKQRVAAARAAAKGKGARG